MAQQEVVPWNEFNLGSNVMTNASGVVSSDGEDFIYLERGARDNQLLVTVDIFDHTGARLAKLRRNAWAFHGEHYDITTHPSSLQLRHRASGLLLLEANVVDENRIQVLRGQLHLPHGARMDISPDTVRITYDTGGALLLADKRLSGFATAMTIDSDSFSIGVGHVGSPGALLSDK